MIICGKRIIKNVYNNCYTIITDAGRYITCCDNSRLQETNWLQNILYPTMYHNQGKSDDKH
jgi:hypothetical protein